MYVDSGYAFAGAYATSFPWGAQVGAYAGYQGLYGAGSQLWGALGGYGWGGGWGASAGAYLGGHWSYSRTPIFQDTYYRENIYQTVTERQAYQQQGTGKMWDVWFDHQDGQKTQQRSPLVLDLNGNGKPDITGQNVTGDGKVSGPTTDFDIDPSRDSWQFRSRRRRPGKGAPKAPGGHWENRDGRKLYVDKQGNVVGEMKDGQYYWGKKESKEKTEWLAKNGGDGFLVWDVDKDGQIKSSKELFGEFDIDGKKRFANGYEKLAYYFDKNKDGKVEGDELKGLQIWKDANADGKVDAGELQELSQYNITSFDVKNYNRQDMSSTYGTTTTGYREVQRQQLVGYNEYWRRDLVGYQDQWSYSLYGGGYNAWGGYGYGGWGGWWC
ncbi:MAG TPA: hypothetical protein VNO81_02340 [Candidatus Nitrosotenuis sp.]|jgi:hypothetical protein|nr:hypothetical protein [Candidatus Nitrosotenuis sp.]